MEQKLSPRRQVYDRGLRALLWVCAGVIAFEALLDVKCEIGGQNRSVMTRMSVL